METVTLPADIKENYLSDFKSFSALYGRDFSPLRQDAIKIFKETGFPERKNEEWKYLNLSPVVSKPFTIAKPFTSSLGREDIARFKVAGPEATVLVFINGIYHPHLSDIRHGSGIQAGSLMQHDVNGHLGQSVFLHDNPFNALNTAFFSDGAWVNIAAGMQMKEAVHILHLNDSRSGATISFPRNIVVAGENSNVQLIASYHSLNDAHYSLTDSVTEIYMEESARLEFDVKQNEHQNAYHFSHIYATQKRNSNFDICTVTIGGAMVRNNLTIRLSEVNCTAHLYGLTLGSGSQVMDHHTVVDHASPNCFSNQLYKSILDGHAQGVFNGKIFVRKDAQKTNAYQSNKNILLSHDAVMNAKPQLEIFADDVKCSHGATTGQLDDNALFYFRSRGIGEQDARALLNFAFASDVIEKINNDHLKKNLLKLLATKLHSQIEFDLA